MEAFVFYIGWTVCAAGALVAIAGIWYGALRLIGPAVQETGAWALFLRWFLIRHIRKVRAEERKAFDRAMSHTQCAAPKKG